MKIMFFGTPEFAATVLKSILHMDIVCVVSQPDKKQGRKMILTETPVKRVAGEIPVIQPEKLGGGAITHELDLYKPDIIVVVAYGKLLPEYILNYPKYGCINIHASLLPKLRGAAPIQWAIINGEQSTGVSIMYMTKELDAGDVIYTAETPISNEDTSQTLFERLANIGSEALIKSLHMIEKGEATAIAQEHDRATYAPMLTKDMGNIDWTKSAEDISRLIRGLIPWPLAHTCISGKCVKIWAAEIVCGSFSPGEMITTHEEIVIGCGENGLKITELQFEGKKRMKTGDFLRGNRERLTMSIE